MILQDSNPDTPLTQSPYRASLKAAQAELEEVKAKASNAESDISEIDNQLAELKKRRKEKAAEAERFKERVERLTASVEALRGLCDDEREARWSERHELVNNGVWKLQECCYQVLLDAGRAMTAAHIHQELRRNGVEYGYQNPLAVIHTSLKRMIPDRVRRFKALPRGGRVRRMCVWYEAVDISKTQPQK